MEKELEKLPKDYQKDIFKSWGVRFGNYALLKKKVLDEYELLAVFASLSFEAQNILIHLCKPDVEITVDLLAHKLGYSVKKFDLFNEYVEEIARKGFIYMRRKRAKLSKQDDKLFVFDAMKDILLSNVYSDTQSIFSIRFKDKYKESVYKKYESKVKNLYELGGHIEREEEMSIANEDLVNMLKAKIVKGGVLFKGKETRFYYVLGNENILSHIKTKEEKKLGDIHYIFNHYNLINDIEMFIYYLEESRVRRLKNGNIESVSFTKKNFLISSRGVDYEYIFKIANALELVYFNDQNELCIEYEKLSRWQMQPLDYRLNEVYRVECLEHENVYSELLAILEPGDVMTPHSITSEYNRRLKSKQRTDRISSYLYMLYLIGYIELGVDEKGTIVAAKAHIGEEGESKSFLNSNFELMIINHLSVSSEFIYLLNAYADLNEEHECYNFHFTEESVVRGKAMVGSSESFLAMFDYMKNELKKSKASVPKNIELTLKKWHDRSLFAKVKSNVTLIRLDNAVKIHELEHIAKKEGIVLSKISEHYAIVSGYNVTTRKIVKLFRKEKINLHFLTYDDNIEE